MADLYNSSESKAPDENFLKNRYVTQWDSKNAPFVFIPKGSSILPIYLGSNCLGKNQKKCLNESIEEHTQIFNRESFAESLTQVGKFEKEWGIRPDHTNKVTKYNYLIRQNGNYVIGLSEDGSRKFYFLINLSSGKF